MNKVVKFYFFFAVLSGFTFLAQQWKYVPKDATIKFYVKEEKGYEEGVFNGILGDVYFDENDLSKSNFTAIIDVNTINTGIEMRDESLRSADFFESTKYPTIKFSSTQIIKTDTGFCAKGNLKIKNVSKIIDLPFTFATTNDSLAVFKGTFSINRYDYIIGKKGDGVGNIVRIDLNIPVKK